MTTTKKKKKEKKNAATASQHPERTGLRKGSTTPGARLAWSDVLRAVQADAARSTLVRLLTEAGFSVDDFAGSRNARVIVCTALSRFEDQLECSRYGKLLAAEQGAVRAVRRRLELELWP